MSNPEKQTQNIFPPDKGVRGFGFTLIELLVTISLMGILFAISAPIFSEFRNSSRLKSSVQMIETAFGEAFSGARSRPEYFIITGNGNSFVIKSCKNEQCENTDRETEEINRREFTLNPGVTFTNEFEAVFQPPFGDIKIAEDDVDNNELKITIKNTDSVSFKLHQKSGLLMRLPKSSDDEN